jgi:predicted porin
MQARPGEATRLTAIELGPRDGGDGLGASIAYAKGPLYAALGYLQTRTAAASFISLQKRATVAISYDFGPVTANVMAFYTNNLVDFRRYFAYGAGFAWPIGALKIIGNFARIDERDARSDFFSHAFSPNAPFLDDANEMSLGATYVLSRRTDLYAVAAKVVNTGAAAFALGDNSNSGLFTSTNVPPGFKPWSMQFGIRHRF